MADDPLLNLQELVTLSYGAQPGPYFIQGNVLMAYDKFCQPQIVATLRTDSEVAVATAMFLSMMTPASIRDIARQVEAVKADTVRLDYLCRHGCYEFRNMTGDGLRTAIDAARNKIYDDD